MSDASTSGARPEIPEMLAGADPLFRFADWLKEAEKSEPNDPTGMALATVDGDGMPDVRMVLLKGYDARGFVFYTNFESAKGEELLAQPKAALLFHWKSLRRQVRIRGEVSVVSEEEADAYFASRPRDSRIGAWASRQSRPLKGRAELVKEVARYALKYPIGAVPRPPQWSGFRITPLQIEFWRDGAFRLHDRLVYRRDGADQAWRTEKLFP
ncbi:Pyridoxine/pyridoxamine 5'-phosphate oxidase [Alphaproteobacteria bacterium SO-S41]|nr:Pyridoxine/pyridoxamine 5'-phosphate oxidase [Alphaproteobacteria bacterium SO-S41]